MRKYTPPCIDYKRSRRSIAIPDQSLSIQEIVRRFVRGIPVDVIQRTPIYNDQSGHDLEKLSRMDFGEKYEYAQAMAAQAAQLKSDLDEAVRSARRVAQAEQAQKKAEAAIKAAKANKRQPAENQHGVN